MRPVPAIVVLFLCAVSAACGWVWGAASSDGPAAEEPAGPELSPRMEQCRRLCGFDVRSFEYGGHNGYQCECGRPGGLY